MLWGVRGLCELAPATLGLLVTNKFRFVCLVLKITKPIVPTHEL